MANSPLPVNGKVPIKTHFAWSKYEPAVMRGLKRLAEQNFFQRILKSDPLIWKEDPSHHKEIQERLGWIRAPKESRARLAEIKEFVSDVLAQKYAFAVLLGMGGSSLAPEVFQTIFGNKPGHPKLVILDSTDPRRVADVDRLIAGKKALFIVSSKSGSTIQSLGASATRPALGSWVPLSANSGLPMPTPGSSLSLAVAVRSPPLLVIVTSNPKVRLSISPWPVHLLTPSGSPMVAGAPPVSVVEVPVVGSAVPVPVVGALVPVDSTVVVDSEPAEPLPSSLPLHAARPRQAKTILDVTNIARIIHASNGDIELRAIADRGANLVKPHDTAPGSLGTIRRSSYDP